MNNLTDPAITLRRLSPNEYEFTRPDLSRDYHARLEDGCWVVDVFDLHRRDAASAHLRSVQLDSSLADLVLFVIEDDAHDGLDPRFAHAEGWGLYNAGEIQRVEEAERFATDEEAIAHVKHMAEAGSAYHRAALRLHRSLMEPGKVRAAFNRRAQ